jgi:hypothetical protein
MIFEVIVSISVKMYNSSTRAKTGCYQLHGISLWCNHSPPPDRFLHTESKSQVENVPCIELIPLQFAFAGIAFILIMKKSINPRRYPSTTASKLEAYDTSRSTMVLSDLGTQISLEK